MMTKMRVLHIVPPMCSVPPLGYGGTERVVDTLAQELVGAGHEAVVHTVESSTFGGERTWHYEGPRRAGDWAAEVVQVATAFRHIDGVDVIHNHTSQGVTFSEISPLPMLTTLHNLSTIPSVRGTFEAFRRHPFVAVSHRQAHLSRMQGLNVVAVIPNGIPADFREVTCSRFANYTPYLLHIGALSRNKGTHLAIEVAKMCGMKLLLAGPIRPINETYFKTHIKSRIDNKTTIHLGEIGGADKFSLFANASATLCPIQWEEPFGLVAIESMVAGTPVIGFNRGALPEVIDDGVTGYVVNTLDEMPAAIAAAILLSAQKCSMHAIRKYSGRNMAQSYVSAYERVASGFPNYA